MKYSFLAIIFLLSACAHDVYSVIPNSDGSGANMSRDLRDCKHEAVDKYFANKPSPNPVGLVVGGALAGAIGGAILGASTVSGESKSSEVDINKEIEDCMFDRGYEGTSGIRN